ncbi:MAG TPA: Hcp family type VI secretion system effector [archaeon]|nr:Hcp family type VI secretion system effector [archaeon]
MAMTSYMMVTGRSQGEMKGDCTQEGEQRKDKILVYDISHTIEIPRDRLTGLPTGQRIHMPLTVTKHFDKSSPLLYQALCSGEQCDVELYFFRITEKGTEEHYFTVKLMNAIVVELQAYKPMVFLPENKPYHDMEKVSFTYSKIIWTYVVDGIESEDDWQKPKA